MKDCIFITGAAAGIGRETALLFAAKGWFVGAADRDEAALVALREELGNDRCSTHVMDVVDEASVKRALRSLPSAPAASCGCCTTTPAFCGWGRSRRLHWRTIARWPRST
jgi:NADP-dependent 3-hydroxy acid dehydrogenase YdfG